MILLEKIIAMKKLTLVFLFNFVFSLFCLAQEDFPKNLLRIIVVNGESLPYTTLPSVRIHGERVFKSAKEKRKYNKMVNDVKKVYPYARVAGLKIKEFNLSISKTSNENTKDVLMERAEADLKKTFEKDILDMSYTQGKILIKLIDRETGSTSYDIVKEFRGTLQAMFWQTLARVFGNNLKWEYNELGDDKLIEEIVVNIENGDI